MPSRTTRFAPVQGAVAKVQIQRNGERETKLGTVMAVDGDTVTLLVDGAQVTRDTGRVTVLAPSLEAYWQHVQATARRYARNHGWCSVVNDAIRELSQPMPPEYQATITVTVDMRLAWHEDRYGNPAPQTVEEAAANIRQQLLYANEVTVGGQWRPGELNRNIDVQVQPVEVVAQADAAAEDPALAGAA